MDNKYLSRGKRKDNGEWVHGYYFEQLPPLVSIAPKDYIAEPSKHFIVINGDADWNMPRPKIGFEVDPETICRCTGHKDWRVKDVYNGDILEFTNTNLGRVVAKGYVYWHRGCWTVHLFWKDESVKVGSDNDILLGYWLPNYTIIGNRWDNPELLTTDD